MSRYVLSFIFAAIASAQAPVSIWEDVYNTEQAGQGEISYRLNCASCHGEKLEGKGKIPPLSGEKFLTHWDGVVLNELFEKIQTTMPPARPGQLDREETTKILAYMLKVSEVPPGQKLLSSKTDDLKLIRFDAKNPKK